MASPNRRALIAGALVTGAMAVVSAPRIARAAPGNGTMHYNILRNGKPFGNYTVAFANTGDTLLVTTDVAMTARVAGLTVFDYKHHCEETWRGGRFMEMHSHSVRDNQSDQEQLVSAVRIANGSINVTNKSGVLSLPPAANPLTHWNPAVLAGPLFNPQDGYPLKLMASQIGHESFPLANGTMVNAVHWALRGPDQIDDWYDDNGVWIGLRGVLPDKSTMEYRRT